MIILMLLIFRDINKDFAIFLQKFEKYHDLCIKYKKWSEKENE